MINGSVTIIVKRRMVYRKAELSLREDVVDGFSIISLSLKQAVVENRFLLERHRHLLFVARRQQLEVRMFVDEVCLFGEVLFQEELDGSVVEIAVDDDYVR